MGLLEQLFAANVIFAPVVDSYEYLRTHDRAVNPVDVVGEPLDKYRAPLMFRFAGGFLLYAQFRDIQLLLDSRITSLLYRRKGDCSTTHVVPFGESVAFNSEAVFQGLTLRPGDQLGENDYVEYERELYEFPDNPMTLVYGRTGGPMVRVDQREAGERRNEAVADGDQLNMSEPATVPVKLHVYRFSYDDGSPSWDRVYAKLDLMNRSCVHENGMSVSCSVTQRVSLPRSVVDNVFSKARIENFRPSVIQKFLEYSFTIPYDCTSYTFVVTFRKPIHRASVYYQLLVERNKIENSEDGQFHVLRVECRQSIEFDSFARIATALIDFFAYQYTTYGGIIDEFLCCGPKWQVFRRGMQDGVFDAMERITVHPMRRHDDQDTSAVQLNKPYNMLIAYLALRRMADASEDIRETIFRLPDEQFAALRKYKATGTRNY